MTTRFDWDPAKAAANKRKHRISFDTALRIFADPFVLTFPDRVEDGEQRWQSIGLESGHVLLVVAHTIREWTEDGEEIEVIRIISARHADRSERRLYEGAPR